MECRLAIYIFEYNYIATYIGLPLEYVQNGLEKFNGYVVALSDILAS